MSTIAPSLFNIAEPIPGYRTRQRIGAGGYGEVWKAEAPGGIAKAIKIVFGYHDDERAKRELNALNRIKEATHPFVLSLERIEMVDGHLVIVTELATCSMKSLFEQHRRSGLPGIPRAELLGYLRDAADALDYLCREHSLQHLDVKPENLLLVGGRVKVGDFGLVKDLQEVNSSMVTGLTPVYAAPELFDGRPNNRSDQYSLAIVYQEMLTGTPPFEGRTTAQLAAQHLHSRPRLDRLPASDQAAIARALSKDPEQRFPSCRELIDTLLEVTPNYRPATASLAQAANPYFAPPVAPTKTEVLSREETRAAAAPSTAPGSRASEPMEPAPAVRDLPPLELRPEDVQYRPTVFVGIGGLAAKTLQSLQGRLANEFGDARSVPALQVLLFDTDAATLKAVTEGDSQASLRDDSAILLPLRPPADYRCESSQHLRWLSRRWIYNIPRSLQTQGLRPLGRLAFVDHCERVTDRIGRAIKTAVDPEGLAQSAEKTGLPFREAPPRVFIVSSITGGTGGGMILDVAYLVRKVLRDLGLSEEGLCGLLAHCTGRSPQGRDLAVANAYAFLSELHHYSDLYHAYPGDPVCGLPAFGPEDAPFTHAYLVHLGEDLEQKDFLAATSTLAKFLYSNAVTPAAAFFDKCRARQDPAAPSAGADPTVRTFGLCQLGFSDEDIPSVAADELCKALVIQWRGTGREEPKDHPASLSDPNALLGTRLAESLSERVLRAEVASRAAKLGLDVGRVVDQLHATAIREMGTDPDSYLLTVLGQVVSNYQADRGLSQPSPPGELILDVLNSLIRSQDVQDGHRLCLESVLEKHLEEMAPRHGAALCEWILGLVLTPKRRVEGAQHAADCLDEYLRAMGREAGESAQTRHRQLSALKQSLLGDKSGSRDWLRARGFASRRRQVADQRLSDYFQLSIEELALNGVCRLVGLILAQIATLNDKLRNLAADLNRLAEEFGRAPQPATAAQCTVAGGSETVLRVVSATLSALKAELTAEMERDLEEYLRCLATTEDNDARRVIPHRLRRAARFKILRALKKVALGEITASADGKPCGRIFSLAAGLKTATPRMSECGGQRRLLLVTPEDLPPAELLQQLGDKLAQPPTVIAGPEDSVLLCYDVEGLPLRRVAAAVLDRRFPNAELASRLHTRIDVPWSPL